MIQLILMVVVTSTQPSYLKRDDKTSSSNLCVATAYFDSERFMSEKNWKLSPFDQDKESVDFKEVDFSKVDFSSCLDEDEIGITGEEKLRRLKDSGRIRHGATVFAGLWKDYQERKKNSVLERLFQKKEKGITRLHFFGDVLLNPGGERSILSLYRCDDGEWSWSLNWLEDVWSGDEDD